MRDLLFFTHVKKSRQKKALFPDKANLKLLIANGIFRFAIHGESKNGGHPARRPMGLQRLQSFTAMKIKVCKQPSQRCSKSSRRRAKRPEGCSTYKAIDRCAST
jgi:hypothetical protein